MKRVSIICLVIALSTLLTAGSVKALQILGADVAKVGDLEAGSLTVGEQGVGGVTFFNGTIVNQTTGDNGSDNPVTFGDNVRIDGRVYRGETAGAGDGKPFTVNDDMLVQGQLMVNGVIMASEISTLGEQLDDLSKKVEVIEMKGATKKIYSGEFDVTQDGDFQKCDPAFCTWWDYFKIFDVPEIQFDNMPLVSLYTEAECSGSMGYGKYMWQEHTPTIYEEGKIHYQFKQSNLLDGIVTYSTTGKYKIVVIY